MTLKDNAQPSDQRSLLLNVWPATADGLTIVVGLLVLLGWAINAEFLKRVLPGFVAMNPMTAIGFICAGLSLALLLPRESSPAHVGLARLMGAIVALIGLAKLISLVTGADSDLDRILFASKLSASIDALPNRMAPNTAWNFLLLGVALITFRRESKKLTGSQVCALFAAVGALLPLTGYLYGVQEFRGLASFIPMAVHTAVTFLIFSSGLVFAASTPLSEIFATTEPQGVLVRRLLPLAVGVTLFLGWLRLWAERRGYYESSFGTALFAVVLSVILVLLVRWTASTVTRLQCERSAATARLQEANRRKDEMIAVVSHDLCSPLTGFRMVIDLLREGQGHASDELLDLMDHSARRMVSMVRGLLDVSKLHSDQLELEREDLLISEVIRQSLEPLAINANAKNIDLSLKVDEGEPILRADRLRVSQIFNNLLSNAVKFTSPGGHVSVTVQPDEQGIRVVVSDTGTGIPPNELPHVFEKYFQATTRGTAGEKGVGLGLAIVRELVLLHGGWIDVASELNRGTSFTVFLPTRGADSGRVTLENVDDPVAREIAA